MNLQNNVLTSFIKASLLTAVLVGSLVAQSYATTTLFADAIMKMNVAFSSESDDPTAAKQASMTVQNEQESSITFGKHKLDITSQFIAWDDDAKEHEQILAKVKVMKINESGETEVISNPSLLIMRNKWAEVQIKPEDGSEGFELKMQYEDIYPSEASLIQFDEPIWLNWGDKTKNKVSTC
ncbi:MAG: hypothetical protein R3E90_09605 [Marinicella sp.]|nr:hypothetical protein [Xanthomonadales bacterium]